MARDLMFPVEKVGMISSKHGLGCVVWSEFIS